MRLQFEIGNFSFDLIGWELFIQLNQRALAGRPGETASHLADKAPAADGSAARHPFGLTAPAINPNIRKEEITSS